MRVAKVIPAMTPQEMQRLEKEYLDEYKTRFSSKDYAVLKENLGGLDDELKMTREGDSEVVEPKVKRRKKRKGPFSWMKGKFGGLSAAQKQLKLPSAVQKIQAKGFFQSVSRLLGQQTGNATKESAKPKLPPTILDDAVLKMAAEFNEEDLKVAMEKDQDKTYDVETAERVKEETSNDTVWTKAMRLVMREKEPGDRPVLSRQRAFLEMCYRGDFEDVEMAFENNQPPNFTDKMNRSGLYLGTLYGHFEIVRVTILNGTDPNIKEKEYERTALHVAAMKGYGDILEFIHTNCRKFKPNLNAQDKNGMTPAILAVREGNFKTMKYLLAGGASAQTADNLGWTALHYACAAGFSDMVEYLVLFGANLRAVDDHGQTPGDVNETAFEEGLQNKILGADAVTERRLIRSLILENTVDWRLKAERDKLRAGI